MKRFAVHRKIVPKEFTDIGECMTLAKTLSHGCSIAHVAVDGRLSLVMLHLYLSSLHSRTWPKWVGLL